MILFLVEDRMAFRIVRQRKEARRNVKLDEIFQERDKAQTGNITYDQLAEIYRIYEVDLDEGRAARITDENGLIAKADFVTLAKDTHLLDFEGVFGEATNLLSPKKSRRRPASQRRNGAGGGSGGQAEQSPGKTCPGSLVYYLTCCCSEDETNGENKEGQGEQPMDKIETAFRKFDLDGDGFLSWHEFQLFGKDLQPQQALRIFNSCNKAGDGMISLAEFREMVNRKPRTSTSSDMRGEEGGEEKKESEEVKEEIVEVEVEKGGIKEVALGE